ncbi:MAG: helix-turn-helix domain-containing protein [Gammaproteobacteria bacterium]
MSINARVRQARKAAGLSQAGLAKLLGVTRSACSQWESAQGTVPRRDRLEQLANLLGVSYEWLATGRKGKEDKSAFGIREDSLYKPVMTPDQEELLRLYRELSLKARLALMEFLRSL